MRIIVILAISLCIGCSDNVKLNSKQVTFDSFKETDSLSFVGFYNGILDEPSKMLLYDDYLILNGFNRAYNDFISIFSLKLNKLIKTCIPKGSGPNEMQYCKICILGNDLWLYDMGKFRIGSIPIKNLLHDSINIVQYNLPKYYYDMTMLNDSIMLGTNDLSIDKKISYVNIKNGNVAFVGDYSYLNKNVALGALIDASNCYVNVNPKSKAISLAYRYTDVVEIYNSKGALEYSLHGPKIFDMEFDVSGSRVRKNKDTRKAFVSTYVTENNIYLLYSGCTKEEQNWSFGTEIYVYSWQGKPKKRYILNQPIYTFIVNEENGYICSYSLQTGELIKAVM